MPLNGRFSKVSGPGDITSKSGVYEFGEKQRGKQSRQVVYIGKTTGSLRNRVFDHKGKPEFRRSVRTKETPSKVAELHEAKEILSYYENNGEMPRYNDRMPDHDNRFLIKLHNNLSLREIQRKGTALMKRFSK
jgi:excinuclease UvrABC nuclease subunit